MTHAAEGHGDTTQTSSNPWYREGPLEGPLPSLSAPSPRHLTTTSWLLSHFPELLLTAM